jgi:hypothetical protein
MTRATETRQRKTDAVTTASAADLVLAYRREPEPDDPYEVGSWRGMPHFRCRRCAFDTLAAGNMLAHLDSHAGSEPVNTTERDTEVSDGNSG